MLGPRSNIDLVDLCYDAALDTSLWPMVLARFADAVGAEGAALTYQNQSTGRGSAIIARLDPAMEPPYFGHFATRNPLQQANDLEGVRRNGVGLGPDHLHVPRSELIKSEYYNDFMVPFDINSVLMVALAVHDMDAAVINLMRPRSKPLFDTQEIEYGRFVHRHFIRAFELARRLGQTRQDNESVSALLARSPHGLFLLDDDGRIRFANKVAEAMIAAADGLGADDRGLVATTPDVSQRLACLIGKATLESDAGGGAMQLPRPSGRRPYSVIVARMGTNAASMFNRGSAVVVCITDPEGDAELPDARLRDLFGLTRAETRIAAEILAGRESKSIARSLGLSVNTVRVHTARIFAKTQTSRQAELVRLMMQLSGAYQG